MLPSLQFTDFHKFLVSAGGLACVAAGALPIFLLRTQKTVSLTTTQLGQLSEPAREATYVQQGQLFWLLRAWPWASGALLLIGISLLGIGGYMWKQRQDVLNRKEASEIKKIDAERDKAYQEAIALGRSNQETPEETEEALKNKIEEMSLQESDRGTPETPTDDALRPPLTAEAAVSLYSKRDLIADLIALSSDLSPSTRNGIQALAAEEVVAQILQRSIPADGQVIPNVKLEKAGRADFLVLTKSEGFPDLAVKVVVIRDKRSIYRVALEESNWALDVIERHDGHKLRPVVIIVLPSDAPASLQKHQLDRITNTFMSGGLSEDSGGPATYLIYSVEALTRLESFDLSHGSFTSAEPFVSATY